MGGLTGRKQVRTWPKSVMNESPINVIIDEHAISKNSAEQNDFYMIRLFNGIYKVSPFIIATVLSFSESLFVMFFFKKLFYSYEVNTFPVFYNHRFSTWRYLPLKLLVNRGPFTSDPVWVKLTSHGTGFQA